MKMFDVGRLCVKLAGRDAGQRCVVVDKIDDRHVLIDGMTRRRKCNVLHLEALDETLKIKKGAIHTDVKKAFKTIGIELVDTKPKKAKERPKKVRKGADKKKKESDKPKANPEIKEKPKVVKKKKSVPKKKAVAKKPVKKAAPKKKK
ncbi:50S ribosomal protein L14e [Candidatus Woesearchaeota archaeon]|nr:50S ribosomal protein L14e [Candidatus Woesearchaeota archaeon]